MRWTQEQLEQYRARHRVEAPSVPCPADPGPEKDLQAKAEKLCRERGYHFFHDRSRGANVPGQTDLVIALPKGRTVWVELKSKHGRLSADQKRVRMMLSALGHEWHDVRSYSQFVSILDGGKEDHA
jgi:hypothetical protein